MSIEGVARGFLLPGLTGGVTRTTAGRRQPSASLMKTLSGRKLYAHYAKEEGYQHLSDTIRDGPDVSRLLLKVHETVTAHPFL